MLLTPIFSKYINNGFPDIIQQNLPELNFGFSLGGKVFEA